MRSAERGTSMVETTIALLLALTMIFGVMEFGRALFAYHAVSNAARLGTRYAIVHGANCIPSGCTATTATIQTYVQNSTPGLNQSNLSVVAAWGGTAIESGKTCDSGNENRGCTVTVSVAYPFTFILPYFGFGPGFNMSSSSQMVVAN